jgi:hypothetical protein
MRSLLTVTLLENEWDGLKAVPYDTGETFPGPI